MYTKWAQHLKDPESKAKFETYVKSSKELLDRLNTILQDKEIELNRSEIDMKSFESPNWAYRQAFKNGQRSTLEYLRKLIDLDQQDHN